jgi:hypothetical protein
MTSVAVTVPDTAEIHLAGYKAHRQSLARLPFRLFLGAFQLLVIAVGYSWLVNPDTVLIGAVIMAFGAYPFLQPFLVRWRIRRAFPGGNAAQAATTWTFDDEGVAQVSSLVKAKYSWKVINHIIRRPDGLLLYPEPRTFFWLPLSCFNFPTDVDVILHVAHVAGVQNICPVSAEPGQSSELL